ncbi:MAG: NADH-quinone oxidoreductase subunit L [Acidimicrobiia bacterium]
MTGYDVFRLAAEAGSEAGDGGLLAEWAWLIPAVPFLSFLAIVLVGKRLPRKGAEIGIAAVGFSFVYGMVLFLMNAVDGVIFERSVELAEVGPFAVEAGWVVDGLSTMMFVVVGVVAFAVHVYSLGYMRGEPRFTFYYAALSLFTGSMLLLTVAPNLLQMLVGWELVGLCSYLLIGHWWEEKENSDAAVKAFITTKSADVGFVIGVLVLTVAAGSFRFSDIFDQVAVGQISTGFAVAGGVLLFIGAMGKSAQFPLHVWLPDAMAGPTPVSALIHAATMVTAGVYMLGRLFPLYEGVGADARTLVLVIGTVTLLGGGLLALVQDDIKRVLAYSTVSQLGYMVAAMGVGAYTAGLFHLFTHGFFKALLFLGAGSVIHAVHSNNMSEMGGLRRFMPDTYRTFVIGSVALAGVFPLAGFFSKDEILAAFNREGYTAVLVIGLAGALVTAFYMGRAVFLTFFGEYRGHAEPHESERVMTIPLWALAGLSVGAGLVNFPGVFTGFTDWVATRVNQASDFHPEALEVPIVLVGTAAAVAGILASYFLFCRGAETQRARDRFRIPLLYPLLEHKYFLDDVYLGGLVNPVKGPIARAVDWSNTYIIDSIVNAFGLGARALAGLVYGGLDQRGIDLTVNTVSAATGEAGGALRYTQTGKVQQYAGALFAGIVLLVVGFLVFG